MSKGYRPAWLFPLQLLAGLLGILTVVGVLSMLQYSSIWGGFVDAIVIPWRLHSMLGKGLVLLGMFAASAGCVLGFASGIKRNEQMLMLTRNLAKVFGWCMILANLMMIHALLSHDFSVGYVGEVGSVQTPVYFTIISLWASLSGSILLWGGVLGVYVLGLLAAIRHRQKEYMPWTLGTLLFVCVFFGVLVASVADPFQLSSVLEPPARECGMMHRFSCASLLEHLGLVYGVGANGLPLDGPGPNPLLQNHWLMAFHPPTLYLGYVGMAIPFAMCCAALFAGRMEAGWMVPLRRTFLVPWAFLTVGIIMGGWWSYAVLGWGGFWAWDPVENASFMPWLTGTAFLHSAMMMQRRDSLKTWTLILGMVTFVLTLFGTFLTRSGVFNSVHAFADGPIGPILLGFIAIILVGSVILISLREHTLHRNDAGLPSVVARHGKATDSSSMITRVLLGLALIGPPAIGITLALWRALPVTFFCFHIPKAAAFIWLPLLLLITNRKLLSRDFAILVQNVAFCVFTFTVFLGTVYPILAEWARGMQVSVGEPYFDQFTVPIGVTIVWLMGVGPMLPWGRASVRNAWIRFAWPFALANVFTSLCWLFAIQKPYTLLSIFVCTFALVANSMEYINPVLARRFKKKEALTSAAWQVARRGRRRFGGHIAHYGIIMAVLSIAISRGYRQEFNFPLVKGEAQTIEDYTFTYLGAKKVDEGFRIVDRGRFQVTYKDRDLGVYTPSINTYKRTQQHLPSPESIVTLTHDLQLTLTATREGEAAFLRVIRMPGMVWLWISALPIMGGTMLAIWPAGTRRRRKDQQIGQTGEAA